MTRNWASAFSGTEGSPKHPFFLAPTAQCIHQQLHLQTRATFLSPMLFMAFQFKVRLFEHGISALRSKLSTPHANPLRVADNETAKLTRLVLNISMAMALVAIATFIVDVATGRYAGTRFLCPTGTFSRDIFLLCAGIGFLIAVGIPACGYFGAKRKDRGLLCGSKCNPFYDGMLTFGIFCSLVLGLQYVSGLLCVFLIGRSDTSISNTLPPQILLALFSLSSAPSCCLGFRCQLWSATATKTVVRTTTSAAMMNKSKRTSKTSVVRRMIFATCTL